MTTFDPPPTNATGPIDAAVRARIEAMLADIEAERDVRILFAVESGSRAWGFPSPDSDYDVRFVYVHRLDWYLSIAERRDVIERPIEGALDVNGWDLRKTLRLLLKPNPVLLEWLASPIRYRWDVPVVQPLIRLAEATLATTPSLYHYLRLGETQFRKAIEGKDEVSLKKYFYVLRPALALRWLRLHPDRRAPMALQELIADVDLPEVVSAHVADLVERKRVAAELGSSPPIGVIDGFVADEFAQARRLLATPQRKTRRPPRDEADRVFRDLVRRFDGRDTAGT